MSEEGKDSYKHHHHQQPNPPPQYGTFQGVANYPPQPAIGFPQQMPPPVAVVVEHSGLPPPQYYAYGYQGAVTGYEVVEGRLIRERRLPCCGLGIGWFLFIIGFFLAAIPWYVAAFVVLCARIDHREKPGYIACTIAAILAALAVIFGARRNEWH